MAGTTLHVRYDELLVGRLSSDGFGHLSFAYDEQWLARENTFPISASLPLQADPHHERGHAFFANLLPEGGVRDAVCASLGISRGNDFALLRAIGGECAGALSIVDEDSAVQPSADSEYELVDDRRLQSFLDRKKTVPLRAS